MKVLFIHLDNIMMCPPALSAIQILLDLGHNVSVLSYNLDELPESIKNGVTVIDLGKRVNPDSIAKKYYLRLEKRMQARSYVKKNYTQYNMLWLTSEISVREIGNILLKTKYILQLMEMVNYVPQIGNSKILQFDIKKFAQRAYKVVVPEENRAHIIKARWELDELPSILPNKPYNLTMKSELSEKAKEILKTLKQEKRKIILYQGGFTEDRRFEEFAEAVDLLGDDYVFYLMGFQNNYCKEILKRYPNVVYLGALNPPEHLIAAKYAYIGILTYIPVKAAFYSELNALYCAPNKIYEYALCGLPMIGTNVLGLKYPFEKYNIGRCCEKLTAKCICETVHEIEDNYVELRKNCKKFYNDIDMRTLMEEILQ